MLIVNVQVWVKPEKIQQFIEATKKNAKASMKEPGIARFDFIQQKDNPARFMLVEVYRDEDSPAEHKKTRHYAEWRDTVEPMMAAPRESIKYINIFPDENEW